MTFCMNRLAGVCLVAALAGAGVSGCVPLAIVGGAAGAGTLMFAAERRSNDTQTADRTIEQEAQQSVVNALGGRGHVTVTSYYRKVLLTGEVPAEQDRQLVYSLVNGTPGVQGIVNELAVMPNSGPAQRSSDTYVTGKVKARLMDANGVPANAIRTITERGTTYIMGRLSAQEAEFATQVVRQTSGVERVVRVIDLIVEPPAAKAGTAAVAPAGSVGSPAAAPVSEPATGVVTQPVIQPTVQEARPPIQVQTLPPVK
ncbi:BON domain-containing protein [Ottowia thiooxydans]|uniref:BON domain-containing protein n=1 Tax=Ottowia thiooxydans TaxID=219182 RepID=UPI00041C3C23|nr:BON domain-containing protein [Ottowia thiooxydans]